MPAPPKRILVVDDDALVAEALAAILRNAETDVAVTTSGREALELLEAAAEGSPEHAAPFSVLVVDMAMSDLPGMELIREIRGRRLDAVAVAITGYGSVVSAVEAVRLGAIDYLVKPVVDEELRIAVEKAFNHHVLRAENANLRARLGHGSGALGGILGDDPRMRRIFETVRAVAPTKTTVLMSGESGTGKSMIARAIHHNSPRASKPFVELACGSIPETLLESELFGHARGAFTGAHADKQGRFLAAHGGTIFLDEINSASPAMQLKLLRVIQERAFEPVGATQTVEVDVRIILASNEPLERMVARGEFRQDLYYRINVVMIQLPPLRDRRRDVPHLAQHFLQQYAAEAGREIVGFTDEAMASLRAYAWPGNVRELQNVIERAVVLSQSAVIGRSDLPVHVVENGTLDLLPGMRSSPGSFPPGDWRPMPLAEALREPEKQIILATLNANNWNRQKTADILQINRSTLYKKMKQFGLDEYGETG